MKTTNLLMLVAGTALTAGVANADGLTLAQGDTSLSIGGTAQFRWNSSFRDDNTVGNQDDFTTGFSTPRTRLKAMGTVWSKNLSFYIQGNFGSAGGGTGDGFNLEEAYGKYTWDSGLFAMWGQMTPFLLTEETVADEAQLGMEQGIASKFFSPGYVQGVSLGWQGDMWRVVGAFSDGAATNGTDWNSTSESDYALTARVDVKVFGSDWARFNDFTSWRSASDNALRVGGGVHFQDGGETGGTSDTQFLTYNLDVQYEAAGWNIFAAGYGSNTDDGTVDTDLFGGAIQAGFFVSDQAEIFARWDGLFFDDAAAPGADDNVHFATVGLNYYVSPESHAAKFTGQVGYALNDSTGIFSDTTNGFLGDSEDGEISIGAQFQIMF